MSVWHHENMRIIHIPGRRRGPHSRFAFISISDYLILQFLHFSYFWIYENQFTSVSLFSVHLLVKSLWENFDHVLVKGFMFPSASLMTSLSLHKTCRNLPDCMIFMLIWLSLIRKLRNDGMQNCLKSAFWQKKVIRTWQYFCSAKCDQVLILAFVLMQILSGLVPKGCKHKYDFMILHAN